jgi:DNA-binding response OmpR family regulator
MQILLVEDDPAFSSALQQALQDQDYAVNSVSTGEAALYVVKTDAPDIVVLDLGLPDMDGMEVLRRIRRHNAGLPILLLTARTQLDDKISGLDSGADDYLAKPFEMTELFARIRVLARRLGSSGHGEILVGEVSLDVNRKTVTVSGREIELSRREYMLLKSLMTQAGRVQTRNALEKRLYNWDEEIASNALEVHIHHLRKKLGSDFIKTVRGVGYKVDPP